MFCSIAEVARFVGIDANWPVPFWIKEGRLLLNALCRRRRGRRQNEVACPTHSAFGSREGSGAERVGRVRVVKGRWRGPIITTAQRFAPRGRGGQAQGVFGQPRFDLCGTELRVEPAAQRTKVPGTVAVFASCLLSLEASAPDTFRAAIFESLASALPAASREPLELGLARPTPLHLCLTSLYYVAVAWTALWWCRWAWEKQDPRSVSGSFAAPYEHWWLPVDASGRARWASRSRPRSRTPPRSRSPSSDPPVEPPASALRRLAGALSRGGGPACDPQLVWGLTPGAARPSVEGWARLTYHAVNAANLGVIGAYIRRFEL